MWAAIWAAVGLGMLLVVVVKVVVVVVGGAGTVVGIGRLVVAVVVVLGAAAGAGFGGWRSPACCALVRRAFLRREAFGLFFRMPFGLLVAAGRMRTVRWLPGGGAEDGRVGGVTGGHAGNGRAARGAACAALSGRVGAGVRWK